MFTKDDNFSSVIEKVQRLPLEEKEEIMSMLEKNIAEEKRETTLKNYQQTKKNADKLRFSSSISKLKKML